MFRRDGAGVGGSAWTGARFHSADVFVLSLRFRLSIARASRWPNARAAVRGVFAVLLPISSCILFPRRSGRILQVMTLRR